MRPCGFTSTVWQHLAEALCSSLLA